MAEVDFENPDLYINRELSLLEFNARVLEQSKDTSIPLLERLKFLCISAANLDEFFEIRVAGLKQQAEYGAVKRAPDNLTPLEQLSFISKRVLALVGEQYRILNAVLMPALRTEGIYFLRRSEWLDEQKAWIKNFFHEELAPVLSPLGLDPAHPFPRLLNKSLNFIVTLEGKDAFGRMSGTAIVQAPRSLPRVVKLPGECRLHANDFIFLSSVIHAHVDELFPGMEITGCYQFRCTRNSELFVDEEEVDDLLRTLAVKLPLRHFGDAVRLEVADDCPENVKEFLRAQFVLKPEDVFACPGPVNLTRLMKVPDEIERPDLRYEDFVPSLPGRLSKSADIFSAVHQGDILLHHPFQSFTPVLDFLRQAAKDPQVLAIRQTLYRTGAGSPVVDALIEAAHQGKEVTVVIELRARFDEAANIDLANMLQEAGVHVVYGVVGHKTHAKMIMVVRREDGQLRRYLHLGTGNYHPDTAKVYTDYGLFTCDHAMGEDVQKLFQQLTALGRARHLKKLVQAPFTLHTSMLRHIEREAENARAGRPARIIAKMNALSELQVIKALYQAAMAGVQIDLIVRGMCTLRPGIKGLSENIHVRSIIGRFLEHSRVFYFENGGNPDIFLSSADWMERNFFVRVETCIPLQDKRIMRKVLKKGLLSYLSDNTQAWVLQSDGSYKRLSADGCPHSAQKQLLEQFVN